MILYTRNNCSACRNVKAYLDDQGYRYEEVNIENDYDAAAQLVEAGIRSVPVLLTREKYLIGALAIEAEV